VNHSVVVLYIIISKYANGYTFKLHVGNQLAIVSHLAELRWHNQTIAHATLKALRKNGFDAIYSATKQEALNTILSLIPTEAKVGVGGSVTLREIGIVEALSRRGNSLADPWTQGCTLEEKTAIRRSHLTSDVFLSSTNAVTLDGRLVNVDGTGNRVAGMIFGPKRVIIVAGVNKIVSDLDAALHRIRDVAAPLNTRRLKRKSPCGTTGRCDEQHCGFPDRACNVTVIIERRPSETPTTVVLVGENLGF